MRSDGAKNAWQLGYWAGAMFLLGAAGLPAHAESGETLGRAVIKPSLVRLAPGDQMQFRVILLPRRLRVAAPAQDVKWAVNMTPGGNTDLGTIDRHGVYTAPKQVPSPNEIHICAEVASAANRHLWATVLVGDREPTYEMVSRWVAPSEGPGALKKPHGIALDAEGNLIIADMGSARVLRFTAEGAFLGEIGLGGGLDPGHFAEPRDVVVDELGRIFVADLRTGPPRIQVFSAAGSHLFSFAPKGSGPGQVMSTQGMEFDPDGRLFVADIDNMRVNVYDSSGNFLETWQNDGENPGQLNGPYGLAVDPNGDVFVSSFYGPCQKFTGNGVFLFAFAHPDPFEGPLCFHNATGDRWGNVYLATRNTGQSPGDIDPEKGMKVVVLKYNNNGDLITRIPLAPGEFGETGMAVDKLDRLYVLSDRGDQRVVEVFVER